MSNIFLVNTQCTVLISIHALGSTPNVWYKTLLYLCFSLLSLYQTLGLEPRA